MTDLFLLLATLAAAIFLLSGIGLCVEALWPKR